MQVISDPGLVSGFVYQDPLPGCSWLSHCGEAECGGGHFIGEHHHRTCELMYLTHGRYVWQIGPDRIEQRPGDLFVVFAGEIHQTAHPPRSLVGQLWIGVDLAALGTDAMDLAERLARSGTHLITDCLDLEPLLRLIVRQVVEVRCNRDAVVRSCLQAIIQVILQATAGAAVSRTSYSYPVAKAIEYMRSHMNGRVSMPTLTAIAGCGVSQLSGLFQREVGRSPISHHRRLRLEAARDALRSPDATVTSVAMRFGFASTQHLSSCMRKAFNLTPGDCRHRVP